MSTATTQFVKLRMEDKVAVVTIDNPPANALNSGTMNEFNAILDQMMHVDGASRDQVMRFLTVTAFQEEREAAGKYVRAQLSSTQLSTYFVGVTEHDNIRAEAEKKSGFNLKAYHDKVLSYGSPPARFVRQLMFDQPIA